MWFNKIVSDTSVGGGIANIPNAVLYFESQLAEAAKEVKLSGRIETAAVALPGVLQYRYAQLQEVEAILEYLNINLSKERAKSIRAFMENYNRELTVREAEKWIDADDDVISWRELVNSIAYIRNQYLGILKALDAKNFMIGHIVKLKVAGIDDADVF